MNADEITALAATWCRMWNEEPALAHELMTDDCVQWAATTDVLDTVVGPAEQEAFITALHAGPVNVFVPRLYVIDGDVFAYLWDATLPDGTVMTGVDVNRLQGSLIHENWTFMGPHCADPDPDTGDCLDRARLTEATSDWAAAMGYAVHREPVVDTATGRVALLRATADGVGGIDLLTVRGGGVEPIWSVVGSRPFRY